jgi:hypothetical protein
VADEENAKSKGRGGLKSFVVTIIVIAAILLATAFFAVRTEGGRSFVEGWVAKRLGMELTIKDARLNLPLTLVIVDTVSKAVEPHGKPVFKAREISITPTLRAGLEITVERATLNLMRTSAGDWTPAVFSRLGDVQSRNVAEISRAMRKLAGYLTLRISDSTLNWMSEDGTIMASMNGLSFDVAPVQLPDRNIRYFRLAVDSANIGDNSTVRDVEREWLSSDARDYIELNRIGASPSETTSKFWEAIVVEKPQKVDD